MPGTCAVVVAVAVLSASSHAGSGRPEESRPVTVTWLVSVCPSVTVHGTVAVTVSCVCCPAGRSGSTRVTSAPVGGVSVRETAVAVPGPAFRAVIV